MTMEEAVIRVKKLCPDASYTQATISFDFSDVNFALRRDFSLYVSKHSLGNSQTIYSYSGSGSCWQEAVDKIATQIQGTTDFKETIAETNGKQG